MDENKIIIDCIADLHGELPDLKGGDLLIVAGDLTATDSVEDYIDFKNWILPYAGASGSKGESPRYSKIIIIGGNHDNRIQNKRDGFDLYFAKDKSSPIAYLEDSGTEFEGLKIWGSPWTRTFEGMNPRCKAFTLDTEEELAKKWALIPDDVDILVTHSPAAGLRDLLAPRADEKDAGIRKSVGSMSLLRRIGYIDRDGDGKRRLLVCGHIHGSRGTAHYYSWKHDRNNWKIVNASYVNDVFEPYKEPIRIIWENPSK